MYLQKIHIENFRLLKNVDIVLDKALTLIVGKNNTGKISIVHLLQAVISERKNLSFNDYPLECRKQLYEILKKYWVDGITIAEAKQQIPETKLTFYINYADDGEDQLLGELRNFIIDMDDTQNVAQIDAIYSFDSLQAENLFNICRNRCCDLQNAKENDGSLVKDKVTDTFDISIIAGAVKEQFDKFFSLKVMAVNPSDNSDYQERPTSFLRKLFTCKIIEAERNLDESENRNDHPLANVMNRVFGQDEEQIAVALRPAIDELNRYVNDMSFMAQEKINSLMDQIVEGMVKFGYPSAEDMKLKANTDISLKQQILNSTDLTYTSQAADESLPSTHNGLGYKNLIKISLVLHEFTRTVKVNESTIPLLLIEEPEAHMHPQLQTAFVGFLDKFLRDILGEAIVSQTILSTHSTHIANTVDFNQVRYMRREKEYVVCKDLQTFYKNAQFDYEKKENLTFLQKYLKLSYCDLYFCDKAILVEGASERLLIPRMISKCDKEGLFSNQKPTLMSQYYTIAEVGGAYAHRFYEFIDFLEIPSLILTDIDFVDSNNKKCQYSKANSISNGAIKRWCHDAYDIAVSNPIPLETVLELAKDSELKTNGYRHIEFQMEEKNVYPRSLEESIQNVNRELFEIAPDATDVPIFSDNGESKTDFALKLLTDPKYENFIVPSYIKSGLVWLNDQSKLPDVAQPIRKHKMNRGRHSTKV